MQLIRKISQSWTHLFDHNDNALLTSSCEESSQNSSLTGTTGLWCYCKQDKSFDYMIIKIVPFIGFTYHVSKLE